MVTEHDIFVLDHISCHTEECPKCDGEGVVSEHDSPETHGRDGECLTCPIQVQCDHCEGTGEILSK